MAGGCELVLSAVGLHAFISHAPVFYRHVLVSPSLISAVLYPAIRYAAIFYPDDGHMAARVRAFAPIAEKQIAAAGCAQTAHGDMPRPHARVGQLPPVRSRQIEPDTLGRHFVPGRNHRKPRQEIRLLSQRQPVKGPVKPLRSQRELPQKCLRHFRPYFVATPANGRANRGQHIAGRVPHSSRIRPTVFAAMRASVPRQPA